MKKHVSVFMLMARSTIYKLIGLLVLMAAVEGALFCRVLSRRGGSMEGVIGQSRIVWVFGVCFLLATALLSLTGCEFGGKPGYTLRRLSVSERWIFFWQSVYNVLCFLLLWAVQILIAVALCRLYEAKAAPENVGVQTVFLDFYRSNFLHSLLPFEDAMLWVRNGIFAAALGICAARFPLTQRMGNRFSELTPLACGVIVLFTRGIGNKDSFIIAVGLSLICAGISIYHVWRKEPAYEA